MSPGDWFYSVMHVLSIMLISYLIGLWSMRRGSVFKAHAYMGIVAFVMACTTLVALKRRGYISEVNENLMGIAYCMSHICVRPVLLIRLLSGNFAWEYLAEKMGGGEAVHGLDVYGRGYFMFTYPVFVDWAVIFQGTFFAWLRWRGERKLAAAAPPEKP